MNCPLDGEAYVYTMVRDAGTDAAIALQKKITRGDIETPFIERDVYRKGWSLLKDRELVKSACIELMAAGWIRRIPEPRKHGRPASPKYEINPKVSRGGGV